MGNGISAKARVRLRLARIRVGVVIRVGGRVSLDWGFWLLFGLGIALGYGWIGG